MCYSDIWSWGAGLNQQSCPFDWDCATEFVTTFNKTRYPVIDRFIWDSTIVICDRLNVELDGVDQVTVFSKIAEKARQIEKNDPVYMLIQDLKYLIEMKRLENVQTSEKLLHILYVSSYWVPFSDISEIAD